MEISCDEVQHALQALYPALDNENAIPRVRDVALLGTGFEADVFAFVLEEASGDGQNLILRMYAGRDTAEKCKREFDAMSRLYAAGYSTPKVLLSIPVMPPYNRPVLIMEQIYGVSLGASYWSGIEKQRQESITRLYCLMAELHALQPGDILPDSPLVSNRDPYGIIDRELASLSGMLRQLESREPPSVRNIFAWLAERRAMAPCLRPVIVHGDFHPNNVLVRSDDVPFVIDWSNIRVGDARSDLAWSRLITQSCARPDGGQADLAIYEGFSGNKVEQLGYFEVIAAMHLLLSTLIGLNFGMDHLGLRAETQSTQNVDMIWYVATLLQARTGFAIPDLEETLTNLLN